MNRRGFIRGLITAVGASAGGGLVTVATPKQTDLIINQPAMIGQPYVGPTPYVFEWGDGEVYVKRKDGGFVAVGYITSMSMERPVEEFASWSGEIILVPGLRRGQVFFEGHG